jgi:hexosaminidase
MRLTISLFILFSTFVASAQEVNIIPQPVEMKISDSKDKFILSKNTTIVLAHGVNVERFSELLNEYLLSFYGFKLRVQKLSIKSPKTNIIHISFNPLPDSNRKKSEYHLGVTKSRINLSSRYSDGLFCSIQTLIQLLPLEKSKVLSIPQVKIYDYPRFAYRGLHLDAGRHFMPIDFIKKYIDYIALHKMNYFHWHLTEDQGWRIEIKKYPKLTSVGGWRNGTIIGRYPGTGNDGIKYGGFYTQEQIKEIVKYAADRYITVVPEIEMPGHSSAAIAAYPELSCFPNEPTINYFPKQCVWSGDSSGKQVQQTWGVFDDVFCAGQENTFKFLEDVMDEVLALFPSKYIHVGGDECPKENWKRCTHCQQRMKDNKLKDEHELQSYFIQRMEKYLNKKGRTLIGWDEILEGGLAPNAVVMSWRGEQGGIDAAKQKHNVIMTPGNPVYFDHSQSENEDSVTIGGYNSIEKVYAYEPIPKELNAEEAKYVLGAQANLWTEYIKNPGKFEYMLLPRLAALSEVLWSPKEKKSWDDFEKRLQVQFRRYDLWKVNYSKAYFDLKATVLPTENYEGVLWKLEKKSKKGEIVYAWGVNSFTIPYERPIKVNNSQVFTSLIIIDKKVVGGGDGETFHFNKATGKKITLTNYASKNYPGDGAFTLVNGVQNEKGLAKAKEFLGFSGTDCEAIIDLGKTNLVSNVVIHSLHQKGSWIWRPQTLEVFSSADGINFSVLGLTDDFRNTTKEGNGTMTVSFNAIETKFIKVKVTNWGEIPTGEAGAGNKAWLFIDEIEIN